jgi:hypothetical protein
MNTDTRLIKVGHDKMNILLFQRGVHTWESANLLECDFL